MVTDIFAVLFYIALGFCIASFIGWVVINLVLKRIAERIWEIEADRIQRKDIEDIEIEAGIFKEDRKNEE